MYNKHISYFILLWQIFYNEHILILALYGYFVCEILDVPFFMYPPLVPSSTPAKSYAQILSSEKYYEYILSNLLITFFFIKTDAALYSLCIIPL